MKETIDFIERNLTKGKLEELSLIIIDSYRNDNVMLLRSCAGALLGPEESEGRDKKALFFRLIKLVHPDRLPVLRSDFEAARSERDARRLEFLKSLLSLKKKAEAEKRTRFEYPREESYGWEAESFDDFGMHEESFEEEAFDGERDEDFNEDREIGFLDAVKLAVVGNLDIELSPFDLGQLDGALDLSGYDLYETDGLDFCRGITELDLSRNCIDNLYDLQYLTRLRELYLSDNRIASIDILAALEELEILDLENNDIEDVSPLLRLDNLKLVTLRRNPIRSVDAVEALKRKGVTVL